MTLGYHNNHSATESGLANREVRRLAPRVGLLGGRHKSYSLAERLAARTVKSDGCWLFQGCATGNNGYGQITVTGHVRLYAHVAAWTLTYGPVPAGLKVCHQCDTPRCVNPSHLFLGTQQDNIRDAVRKGRWSVRKLSDDQVAELRALRGQFRQRVLAARFGVAVSTVKHILAGRSRTERLDPVVDPQAVLNRTLERVPCVQLPVIGEVA